MKTNATQSRINNRLSQHYTEYFVGDGHSIEFFLQHSVGRLEDLAVQVDGVRQRPSASGTAFDFKVRGHTAGYEGDKNAIKFTVAPILNADVIVDLNAT